VVEAAVFAECSVAGCNAATAVFGPISCTSRLGDIRKLVFR
jgi:hypothetical protein